MKTRLFFLGFLFTASLSYAQETPVVTIPDANFKSYLLANTAINTNNDTEIQVSEATAYMGTIDVVGLNISSLEGIEAFTNVRIINCFNNQLTQLDVSANTQLEKLYCSYNQLTQLNVSANTQLKVLDCGNNQLTQLDVSANTQLERLYCNNNPLTQLDVSANTQLKELYCTNNSLTQLDVSTNTELERLECKYNQLMLLDLSSNQKLKLLECRGNQLTSLNIKNNHNADIIYFAAIENPNLSCIQIDPGFTPSPTTWLKDSTATYSSDCATLSEEDVATISVKVYPNPVQDLLSIVVLESNEAKLYNMQGQYLETVRLNTGENTLDMTKYATGVYFLTIGNSSTKIVKQ